MSTSQEHGPGEWIWMSRQWAQDHITFLSEHFAEIAEIPWTNEQILMDLPGKWEHSGVLLDGDRLRALSINSIQDGDLYVHALFVAPPDRNTGIGLWVLEHLVGRARSIGATAIVLRVEVSNPRALRYYLGQGFHILALEPDRGTILVRRPVV